MRKPFLALLAIVLFAATSFAGKDKDSAQIAIDNAIIRKKDFILWNSYIKELKIIYNDQIIITKN